MKTSARFLLAILLLAVSGMQTSRAELSELQVKSAYVFNFIKFVEWPAGVGQVGQQDQAVRDRE